MKEVVDKVVTIVAQVIGKTDADLSGRLEEEGLWDSFSKVEIVFAIEDEFDVKLTPDQVAQFRTIRDIVGLLDQ